MEEGKGKGREGGKGEKEGEEFAEPVSNCFLRACTF